MSGMHGDKPKYGRDDRRVLFNAKERDIIWNGLAELWNTEPIKNVSKMKAIEVLMNEFNDEVQDML